MSQNKSNLTTSLPLVSVIIVTRNRPEMICRCLEHLSQQTYELFETIVVDGSSDQQTERLVRQYPSVQYIYLPGGKNKMTFARNLGIRAAQGEIITFIDDDSLVQAGWLENLVNSYTAENVGGVGGRVIDEHEIAAQHQSSGLSVGKVFPDGQVTDDFAAELPQPIEVDRLRGCNMSFRKEVFDQVGLFDNHYDFTANSTFEEVDFCARVRKYGYKLLFNSAATVEHLSARREDGLPRNVTDSRMMFAYYHNRTYFVLVNFGWWGRHLVYLFGYDTIHHLYLVAKYPSTSKVVGLLSNIYGKITGVIAALQKRLKENK